MHQLARMLLVTFVESFATTLVERGVYFYSTAILRFSDSSNLWLALAFGAAYVLGAMSSHRASIRLSEKSLLVLSVGGQLVVHLVMAGWSGLALPWVEGVVFLGNTALGFLNGLKWPVIESYVSAGWTPRQTARVVGLFNVSWAIAVPLGLATAGRIIADVPSRLFLLPAILNAGCLWMVLPLPARPVHLPQDHPERPPAGEIPRLRSLLTASRWSMLCSYSLLWILVALMPRILGTDLGFRVETASALSGLVDWLRLTAFVVFGVWCGWHNRVSPLVGALVVLPGAFFMVLFGAGAGAVVVLAGEALFGFAAGLIYYSALYYAMVVKNASVDAGGVHESLIGLGFAVGPAAGLVGVAMMPVLRSNVAGILVGVGPVMVLCAAGALWQVAKTARGIDN